MGQDSGGSNSNGYTQLHCKLIVAFVSLTYNLIIHQIDITSRHFAVAFKIPIHNIGIYFDKLYSIRCLLIVIGSIIEYGIFQAAGGDRTPDNNSERSGERVRKYVGMISFGLMLIMRIIFLAILYTSSQLSYDVYVILSIEAFFYGFHDGALMGLAAEYIPFVSLFYNVCRVTILIFQFVLDVFWFDQPLFMIQLQTWVCVILTAVSVGLWALYNIHLKPKLEVQRKTGERTLEVTNGINDGIEAIISPSVMFFAGSMFKDFLCPGTLPYALLQRDKCHIINKIASVVYLIGPLTFFGLDNAEIFQKWESYYNGFFILIVPMGIIFIYCFLAMHTQIPSARAIINSRPRVMTMTLILVLFYGFLEPLNFIGIGKYAVRGNPHGYTIQGINNTFALLSRSFFARISVGYSDVRISLGYHLPRFRPNHKMSKSNLAWYIIKQTFRRAGWDTLNDIKLNLKKYL